MKSIALLVFAALVIPTQEEADKAAADLLKRYEEKIMKAKTVQVDFNLTIEYPSRTEKISGELKIGEENAFRFRVAFTDGPREMEALIRSDGKLIIVEGPRGPGQSDKWTPASTQRYMRRTASQLAFLGMMIAFMPGADPEKSFGNFEPKDIKFRGKEKVGDVEATIVSFGVDADEGGRTRRYSMRLWFDPDKLAVVKRTIEADGKTTEEKVSRFELDTPIPAAFFDFQSEALMKEGLAMQLAHSVALQAKFTGRLPKSLQDLTRKPADLPSDVFWPEGGFWIGGAIPKDIPFSSDATHFSVGAIKTAIPDFSPVGAPTDRLKKFFTARIHLQLLKAAAEGFQKATSTLPKSSDDLVKKSEAIRFWPEGGWVGGGKFPLNPWGEAYIVQAGASFAVSVAKPKDKTVKPRDVTPDERRGLENTALPELNEADRKEVIGHFKGIEAESLAERDAATKGIIAKGGGALRVVNERLESEKDPEVVLRLGEIRDYFRSRKMTWETEMKSLRTTLMGPGAGGFMLDANERNATWSMKTIVTAQADFRANDRDGNREPDFWVKDVGGLYGLESPPPGGEAAPGKGEAMMLKLIEPAIAAADATEGRWEYPTLGAKAPRPKAGYLFAALAHYESAAKLEKYDKGKGRHPDKFGFVAVPAEYGVSGKVTFIINEDNTIWAQDLEGEEIDTFPSDPAAEGWRKVD